MKGMSRRVIFFSTRFSIAESAAGADPECGPEWEVVMASPGEHIREMCDCELRRTAAAVRRSAQAGFVYGQMHSSTGERVSERESSAIRTRFGALL
ncbi:hypothetical protein GCM10022261_00570 [Brevibacterium daeguense]|uniref:Uncharacterized protein n=1 Tax=Brevibacterium daeguense TaxID=909936 RepID=A0ABP8EF69_9MICO